MNLFPLEGKIKSLTTDLGAKMISTLKKIKTEMETQDDTVYRMVMLIERITYLLNDVCKKTTF